MGRALRADAERSVRAILEAAERVLAEDAGASMEQIAEAAGLTRITVHRRFANRQALLEALAVSAKQQLIDAIEEARPDSAPALVALYRVTANVLRVKSTWRFTLSHATPHSQHRGRPLGRDRQPHRPTPDPGAERGTPRPGRGPGLDAAGVLRPPQRSPQQARCGPGPRRTGPGHAGRTRHRHPPARRRTTRLSPHPRPSPPPVAHQAQVPVGRRRRPVADRHELPSGQLARAPRSARAGVRDVQDRVVGGHGEEFVQFADPECLVGVLVEGIQDGADPTTASPLVAERRSA